MPVLPILKYPDQRLRRIAEPVEKIDKEIVSLVDNMRDTMYNPARPGIGLAATQVNFHKRVVIMDTSSEEQNSFQVFINPKIISRSSETTETEEGCLSIPNLSEVVTRPNEVTVEYLDLNGISHSTMFSGIASVCIQHEIDHLNGKIFVDHLPDNRRMELEKFFKECEDFTSKLLKYPNPSLNQASKEVSSIDANVHSLIRNILFALECFENNDVPAFSAAHFGFFLRIFVVSTYFFPELKGENQNNNVFINPKITFSDKNCTEEEEECPVYTGKKILVSRTNQLRIKALNQEGKEFSLVCRDDLARVVLHQMEHLEARCVHLK